MDLGYRRLIASDLALTSYEGAVRQLIACATSGRSGYACAANVHMLMEAYDAPDFARIVNGSLLTVPDGMPLVWSLRLAGCPIRKRVYGPELALRLCRACAQRGIPVGFYGGTEASLERLRGVLVARFPALKMVYAWAPPFRPLTADEDAEVVDRIRASGCQILFVGLGCPKQERWMAAHQDRLPGCVQVGVGAFFDFVAGRVRQAPAWMQAAGLEWVFRLMAEPRRLWRRYLYHNPRFVYLVLRQLSSLGIGLGRLGCAGGRSRSRSTTVTR